MALRAQYTKSIAIVASIFFGFSSAAVIADAGVVSGGDRTPDFQGFYTDLMSDNPHDPVDESRIWRENLLEILKRLRLFTGVQVSAATNPSPIMSGATPEQILHESHQLQYEYAAYGLKPDLTQAELDDLAAELVEALELLDEDPGVLTPDQNGALAQTLQTMLVEATN